jgi:uncharacterized membrane protein YjjP (DUF1212 family)
MNKIRLVAFLSGLLLMIIGVAKIILIPSLNKIAVVYTPVVLIIIGAMMILAVRRK